MKSCDPNLRRDTTQIDYIHELVWRNKCTVFNEGRSYVINMFSSIFQENMVDRWCLHGSNLAPQREPTSITSGKEERKRDLSHAFNN